MPLSLESDGNILRKAVWAILSLLAMLADSRGKRVARPPSTLKVSCKSHLSKLSEH